MGLLSMRRPQRALTITFAGILVFFILHQISYLNDTISSRSLSDSVDILETCSPLAPGSADGPHSRIDSAIPSVIHQIWETSNVETYSTKASRKSWKDVSEPLNYTVKLWTEEDILVLIAKSYPWLLPTYQDYTRNIQRADVARLVVLHAEGGIYADLDVYPNLMEDISCLRSLGYEATFAPTAGTTGISNHFFMAQRGSRALEWALHEADRRARPGKRILLPYLQVFWSTGPMMVTSALFRYAWAHQGRGHTIAVMDDKYVKTVVRHATGRSWHGPDGRFLNYIADSSLEDLVWLGLCSLTIFLSLISVVAMAKRPTLRNAIFGRCRWAS